MKKKIAILLTAVMVASLAACGSQPDAGTDNTPAPTQESVQESSQEQESSASQESSEEVSQEQTGETGELMGQTLLVDFLRRAGGGETDDLQALADNLLANPVIEFMSGSMPVEPGYLEGFSKEIEGFQEGVKFGPMMGSIAFVGYLFKLEDGTDRDEFVRTLKENADPRWQICVEANETVVEYFGNTVFFVMCPNE